MKVKIGKYPDRLRCSIHTDYMQKKYGYVNWPEKQTRFENFIEWVEGFTQGVYNFFNFFFFDDKEQKIKVKIDRWDTWSMDHTLAHIVVPMLKQLKETKHGAPIVDDVDVPKHLRMTKKEKEAFNRDGSTTDKFFKRWDWVMDEMIWAFEQKCRDDWESDYYRFEEGAGDGFPFGHKLVWEDPEGRKAHQERMSNGFRLFGKYYEALWD